jgi:hypothetical protein
MPKATTKQQTKKPSAKPAGRGIPIETRDRNFYYQRLKPGERVTIGQNLPRGVMGVQNHGPGEIVFDGGYDKKINVPPDHVRLVPTADRIVVESVDEIAAFIELEFMLVPKR